MTRPPTHPHIAITSAYGIPPEPKSLRSEIVSLRAFLADDTQPLPELSPGSRRMLCLMLDEALRAPDRAKAFTTPGPVREAPVGPE